MIVAAHDEEDVIERRLENLLALDYPAERLEIVVASDASTDRTDELVEAIAAREPRVRLIRCPRGGKVAAQNLAVRETDGEIVAFSDANATWAPDALRKLVRSFADPDVAYVCGRLALERADGDNREGAYWRFELWLREQESRLGSVTGGNGSIYAVRREDYVEVDPRFGHDLALPVPDGAARPPRGLRAGGARVREADADERGRVPAQGADVRALLADHAARADAPGAAGLSRSSWSRTALLRYGSGLLHLGLLGVELALAGRGRTSRAALAGQLALLALARRASGAPPCRAPGSRSTTCS